MKHCRSCLIYYINTPEDTSSFQGDLDKISDWCKENKMKINTKKCKIMRITRKNSSKGEVKVIYLNPHATRV